MELQILGCSGGKDLNKNPTCFLLDQKILIDSGSIINKLESNKIVADIDYLILTHSHLDHIADLPFLVQLAFEKKEKPLSCYGSRESTKTIFNNVFNFELWPDLFEIAKQKKKNLIWNEYENQQTFSILDYEITPVLVNHTVPTHGFIIDDGNTSFAFTGDTYITDLFWQECNKKNNLKSIVVDVSFPSYMKETAEATKHLTPELLFKELDKLDSKNLDIYLTHIKPGLLKEIEAELDKNSSGYQIKIFVEDTIISL